MQAFNQLDGGHKHDRQNSPSLQPHLLHSQLTCNIIAYGLSVSSLLAFSQLTSGQVTQLAQIQIVPLLILAWNHFLGSPSEGNGTHANV